MVWLEHVGANRALAVASWLTPPSWRNRGCYRGQQWQRAFAGVGRAGPAYECPPSARRGCASTIRSL